MSSNNGTIDGVLAAFGFGLISGSKRDPTITREVLDDHNSSNDAGAWSNRLFPASSCGKVNAYTMLRKHLGQVRSFHYANTYIMDDAIWRILPTKRVEIYKAVVEKDGKERAFELLDKLVEDLPMLIDLAKLSRGAAFKESDYPTRQEIRDTFKYSVSFRPIPSSAGLNPALFQATIDELNALHQQRLTEANAALVERFMQPFKTLTEQLKDPKGRKLAPVLDSIREFTEIVPTMDLAGNTELVALAAQMSQLFSAITPEVIKKDEQVQKMLGDTCTNVLNELNRFGQAGFQRRFA